MNECSTPLERHFTACASLAALGVQLKHLDVFGPIRETVYIEQKAVKHTPSDKLYDAFISLLAGAHGLVEINSRLRADPVLQRAFGRGLCAEQSVVQRTLDACTTTTVKQMEQAMDMIYRQHKKPLPARLSKQLATPGCGHEWSAVRKESRLRHQGVLCQTAQPTRATVGARVGQPLC